MTGWPAWANFLTALAEPPVLGLLVVTVLAPFFRWQCRVLLHATWEGGMRRCLACWRWACYGGVVSASMNHGRAWLAGTAVSLAVALAITWWRRNKRRTAAALIGAKSRALRDAVTRRMRDAAMPRPVLAPGLN